MRILAIETSTNLSSVALLDGEQVVTELEVDHQRRTTQALMPTIIDAFAETDWTINSLELIATSTGPGSFTGLRVGIATAKTLAYTLPCPVVGVPSLQAVAAQTLAAVEPPPESVAVIMDAQRNEVYLSIFDLDSVQLPGPQTVRIVSVARLGQELAGAGLTTGPGLTKFQQAISGANQIEIASRDCWFPQAGWVGRLAWRFHAAGHRDDVWRLAPEYHRMSAAEEKLASQSRATGDTP